VAPLIWIALTSPAPAQENACAPHFYRWLDLCSEVAAAAEPWRYVPLDSTHDVWLTLGGDFRLRTESVNQEDFGISNIPSFTTLAERLYLHADLRTKAGFRLFVQFVAANEDGRKPHLRSIDKTNVDVSGAFAEIPIGDATLRLGRREVDIDTNRLVSIRDAAVRRTFDGARLDTPIGRSATVTAFWFRPVFISPGALDDQSREAEEFFGANIRLAIDTSATLNLFVFDRRRDFAAWASVPGPEDRRTYGARSVWRQGAFDVTAQARYQDGTAGAQQQIEAWGGTLDAGVRLEGGWKPRLGTSLGYASGDRDDADATLNTFDPTYPAIAPLMEAPLYFPANQFYTGVNLTLNPLSSLTLRADALYFGRVTRADAIHSNLGGYS